MLEFRYSSLETEKTFLKIGRIYIFHSPGEQTQMVTPQGYSVVLKATVDQLLQHFHCFCFKVTLLTVKRVYVQRVYFCPSEKLTERMAFKGL